MHWKLFPCFNFSSQYNAMMVNKQFQLHETNIISKMKYMSIIRHGFRGRWQWPQTEASKVCQVVSVKCRRIEVSKAPSGWVMGRCPFRNQLGFLGEQPELPKQGPEQPEMHFGIF